MMYFALICALLLLPTVAFGGSQGIFAKVKGNKDIVKVEKTLSAFTKISNDCSADIRFHKSDEYLAVITTDSNIQEYVKLTQKGDALTITMKTGSYDFKTLEIDVYCPTLSMVSLAGSGDFDCVDTIEVESFEINILGSGDMKIDVVSTDNRINIMGSGDISGKVECQNFSGSIQGSGDTSIKGNSQSANINVMGSGDFKGGEFLTKEAKVSIMGSGDVDISAENTLEISIMGSGDVRYFGNPTVKTSVMGSGDIRKG